MKSIEYERTYLAKHLPEDFVNCKSKEILDIYIPEESDYSKFRIRKSGKKYEITKKRIPDPTNTTIQTEETIELTKEEFACLQKASNKRVHKTRYYYQYENKIAEVDVFKDAHEGLVVIEFEFTSEEEMNQFQLPEFCIADITHERFIAGGYLAGKTYQDIEENLEKYHYKRLLFT